MLGRNDKVEFYAGDKWSQGPNLPNVLSSHTSHVVDGDIYVFGGLIADSGRPVFYILFKVYTLSSFLTVRLSKIDKKGNWKNPSGNLFKGNLYKS